MSTSCLDDLSVMYYGRLYWRKGVLHLIKALAVLKQDFLSLRLKIFGKGPLERKIRKLVSKLGLKDEVHFRGHVPYIDLVREIKRADLVTLPSLCEVGPFVAALEAMACKKPLVAFDLPFTREFIVNMYNGLLAKAEDIKDLSEKIRLLLSNKRLRINLGQNAYKCVKEKYDWNVLVKKYINVYENLTH